jgi:asparagine synthase (glutamine-hydrolysing)
VVLGSTCSPDGPGISSLRAPSPAARQLAIRQFCLTLNYGLAIAVSDHEVLVTADWLGLYPVYYYGDESSFIVTSSPALMHCHSGFRAKVDVCGLVGILLLAHSCLGRTMFQGLSRLAAGHVLKYEFGRDTSLDAVALGPVPATPRTIEQAVEAFDDVLGRVVGGAAGQGVRSIYLSGGLDSRLVAGYLRRSVDGEISAVTLGDPRDLEIRGAARVATALGTAHERVPVLLADQPGFAKRTIEADAMTSGLYSLMEWSYAAAPRPQVLTGFLGDSTLGVSQVEWGQESDSDTHAFPAMFASVNSWGFPAGVIKELVREDGVDDVISGVWQGLRDEYDSYPGPPWQRSWWFDLLHRERFLIGFAPKIMATRSWPVLPYVHPDILRLVQAAPLAFLAARRAQVEVALLKFPELARIPLARLIDREWWRLVPRRAHLWTPLVDRAKSSLSWHWHDKVDHWEPRTFLRAFDFDGSGWRALRDEARDAAGQADTWLNRDLVLQLIPPASTDARLKRAIVDATGRKALLGTVLCCRRHFA